jgi:NAD(P)H dehydrogenase (quinone)
LNDAASIAKALEGVTGVYVLVPPILSQYEIFIETKTIIARVLDAWPLASPLRLVALSLMAPQQNREPELIIGTHVLEEALCDLSMPTTFVHAGALHDNSLCVRAGDGGHHQRIRYPPYAPLSR